MVRAICFLLSSIYFILLPNANGCGPLQAGREKTINFTVTNFKLPAGMVYYGGPMARAKVSTISTSKSEAETFVRRMIMQNVKDVLYQQGRSAFLPDSLISSILQQLDIQIGYEPLKCEGVVTNPTAQPTGAVAMKLNCIIIEGTVTNICHETDDKCTKHDMILMKLQSIPPMHLSISGSLKTSNSVMANWSNQMWQSVLNRVLRRISSGSTGSYFFGASVNLR